MLSGIVLGCLAAVLDKSGQLVDGCYGWVGWADLVHRATEVVTEVGGSLW